MENKKFKAYIENVEETEDSYDLILDGIEAKKFDELNAENIQEKINDIEKQIFVLSLSKDIFRKLNRLEESSWISFITTNNTKDDSYPADLYKDVIFDDSVVRVNISDIKPINLDDGKAKIFSMNIFKQSNLNEIEGLIKAKIPKYIENVLVYNVGQGNCNAITNYHCKPYIFYDFGGGAYQNTKTYPGNVLNQNEIEFDFSETPLIILSHWDWDHMVSILKSEHSDIKKSSWIVPKQQIGISHLKVAIELYNNNKLLVWPDNLPEIRISQLNIQKINGTDKNNSGLVLTVYLNNDLSQAVLLPADANYDLITMNSFAYYGLVATHHGASSHNCLLNMPKTFSHFNKIAFSFGKNNTYNHPKRESLYEHALNGWSNTFYTINGHISFGYYSYYHRHFPYIRRMGRIQ